MYGAILGDIIGSPYEFDRGIRAKTSPCLAKNLHLLMTRL